MQQNQLTAGEYQVLKAMENHLDTARVGYVRGLVSSQQAQLREVHNAHCATYRNAGPSLCSACIVQMLRDLVPLFDAYEPEQEAPKAAPKKTTRKKK